MSASETDIETWCDEMLPELYDEGMFDYEEIAEELDLPLGTVKAQLFRAREFLFQMMQSTKDIY